VTLDRTLAILGVLLGIPGALALFLTSNVTLAVMAGVLAALLLGAAFYIRYLFIAPPYTFPSVKVTLTFVNSEKKAVLRKDYKIRPNFSHLKQLEHRNIASDGTISNICWNNVPVPPTHIKHRLGEYEVRVDLTVAPRLWSTFEGSLSYELDDSFDSINESMVYCIDFPTKSANIEILFPPNKPCKRAEVRKLHGLGEEHIGDKPILSASGDKLELGITHPSHGANYAIYWEW
jgi:hypothetical protein